MSCKWWIPMLLKASEGDLDELGPSERDELRAHLAQCETCRQSVSEQRAVRITLQSRTDAPVPPGFAARVVTQVKPRSSWADLLPWRNWTYRLAPLAAGLLVFGIVTARNASETTLPVGLPELAEAWAFGDQAQSPAFALIGREGVSGDVILNTILSAEPDEPVAIGEGS